MACGLIIANACSLNLEAGNIHSWYPELSSSKERASQKAVDEQPQPNRVLSAAIGTLVPA